MRTPNCKYSRRNSYLQVGIHRGRASTFGEKFTVVTPGKTFGKRHCAWGAQKPYEIRADTSIDFQALTRSFHTCSKRLLFEQPYYRKFTVTCGCNPYYVLFFLHLGSRQIHVAGVTPHPDEAWMLQVARNVTMEEWGFLAPGQYLIHDRDTKCCATFQHLIDDAGVERVVLPPRSPNLHAYAERWVRSVKEECLSRVILFGEASLRHALTQYIEHYHHERNHQGKGNVRLFPVVSPGTTRQGPVQCRERLGGLLKYYEREAA